MEAGNVSQITSTEDAIEGRFKAKVKYPPGADGVEVDRFSTYRPSFADDEVFKLLSDKGVEVNAKSPPGPSFLRSGCCSASVPRSCSSGCCCSCPAGWPAASAPAGSAASARSKAQRYEPEEGKRVSFEDVAGIEDAEQELRRDR